MKVAPSGSGSFFVVVEICTYVMKTTRTQTILIEMLGEVVNFQKAYISSIA